MPSHLSVDEVDATAKLLRERFPDLPIVIDLQGAKMRLGSFPPHPIARGARLTFTVSGTGNTLALPHPETLCFDSHGDTLSSMMTASVFGYFFLVGIPGSESRSRKEPYARGKGECPGAPRERPGPVARGFRNRPGGPVLSQELATRIPL